MTRMTIFALAALGTGLAAGPALAQVRYVPAQRDAPVNVFSPYDESYGLSPSYQIIPNAYGYAPAVRVIERCQYPNGWNVTDFDRDLNGIPNGIEHTCPVPVYRSGLRVRY